MSDDGSGIGVGDDGNGGIIIINGGKITALSLDDDGAGIGGADSGSIDEITINGGDITVGSEDGAGIGGGQESSSQGGKITINGGTIRAHEKHNSNENLIGNGNSDSAEESETNFVQINGGNIISEGTQGVYPEPKNESGETLEKVVITVHEIYKDATITLILSDGSKKTVTASGTTVTVYLASGITITNAAALADHYYNSEITKLPTCTVKGIRTYTCDCGDTYTETIKAKGHKCKWVTTKKATYFAKGKKVYKCTECGTVLKKKAIKKLAPKVTVKKSGKTLKVSYKKVKGAKGYQIKYVIGKKKVVKTYKSAKAATRKIKKLKKGTYKVYVRAYKLKNSKKVYSSWSSVKKIKIK